MIQYYKKLYGFSVEENQPLLLLKNPSTRKANVGRYYPAELCFLSGLSDDMAGDNKLMQSISKNTKLNPEQKVAEIDTILTLLNGMNNKTTKEGIQLPSSSQKMADYGIKILKTSENTFKGFTLKPPIMIGGEKGKILIKILKFNFEIFITLGKFFNFKFLMNLKTLMKFSKILNSKIK